MSSVSWTITVYRCRGHVWAVSGWKKKTKHGNAVVMTLLLLLRLSSTTGRVPAVGQHPDSWWSPLEIASFAGTGSAIRSRTEHTTTVVVRPTCACETLPARRCTFLSRAARPAVIFRTPSAQVARASSAVTPLECCPAHAST